MYGQCTTTATTGTLMPRAGSDILVDSPSPDIMTPSLFPLSSPPTQLVIPLLDHHHHHHGHHQQYQMFAAGDFDSVSEALKSLNSETGHSTSSCSSGCSSVYNSPSPLASCCTQRPSLIQRSISSHNGFYGHFASTGELVDTDSGPVRRVFSTGDLHRTNMGQRGQRGESPLSNESSLIIEGMSKACRYGPEEKKERIERYKSKRNLRNFNKKIKYACRKTLADSRPRIRGRFARNDDIEKNPQVQWNHVEDEEDGDNWVNFIDSFSANQFLNL